MKTKIILLIVSMMASYSAFAVTRFAPHAWMSNNSQDIREIQLKNRSVEIYVNPTHMELNEMGTSKYVQNESVKVNNCDGQTVIVKPGSAVVCGNYTSVPVSFSSISDKYTDGTFQVE